MSLHFPFYTINFDRKDDADVSPRVREIVGEMGRAQRFDRGLRVDHPKARVELMTSGPIRPVLKHLFDALDYTASGSKGRGRDQRRKAA